MEGVEFKTSDNEPKEITPEMLRKLKKLMSKAKKIKPRKEIKNFIPNRELTIGERRDKRKDRKNGAVL